MEHYLKKELYEAIRQSPDLFDFIQEAALDGLWYWDLEQPENEWLSPRFWQVLGYDPQEKQHLSSEWQSIINADDLAAAQVNLQNHCDDPNHPYDQVVRYRHRDGSTVWVRCRGMAIRNAQGQAIRMLGAHNDISDLKRTEMMLLEAKNQAEQASLAKSQFLANMSHELRTPLNGIIGLSELALKEQNPEALKRKLQKIQQSGRLLLGIISDILDFSKIEASQVAVQPSVFRLQDVVERLRDLFEQQADEKGLEIRFLLDSVCHKALVGDAVLLTQVLNNLLSNALKFTHQGFVELSINVDNALRDDHNPTFSNALWVRFEVRDSGIGIHPQHQSLLFQPFSQIDASSTRQYGGTGLGLSICRQYVSILGGSPIVVESDLGAGAAFSFSLPFDLADGVEKLEAVEDHSVSQSVAKVLLVEDNFINREVMAEVLSQAGLNVTCAVDGEQALALVNQYAFDMVFMDIHLPLMDGYQTFEQIRHAHPSLPVIAVSAAVRVEDRQKALDLGMNGFLPKPIDLDQLYALLRAYLF